MDKIILFIYIMELVITEKDEQMPDLFDLDKGTVLNNQSIEEVVENFESIHDDQHNIPSHDQLEEKVVEEVVEEPQKEEVVEEVVEEEVVEVAEEAQKEELTRTAQIDPIDILNKEKKDVVDAEAALTATKARTDFADTAAKDAQVKIDTDKLNEEKRDVRILDSRLARWTRMDLFPGITPSKVYPRKVHLRTQRKDFLGRGMGKIYPFGHKNQYQMSGSGGSSSDVIKLRRLFGRNKIAKNDGTEEVQPKKMGRLNKLT
tara:strand:+ start:1810 stop:2589 length:780 start_codon:yes stop_codon:yes gene_type:complete